MRGSGDNIANGASAIGAFASEISPERDVVLEVSPDDDHDEDGDESKTAKDGKSDAKSDNTNSEVCAEGVVEGIPSESQHSAVRVVKNRLDGRNDAISDGIENFGLDPFFGSQSLFVYSGGCVDQAIAKINNVCVKRGGICACASDLFKDDLTSSDVENLVNSVALKVSLLHDFALRVQQA